ncbi:MAG TPA: type II secretion system protein [Thermoanaerobaculaceae bacterium]|nr:type II secretion system protein [Thermoanaerobaculaceae bacterium]HRS16100.1 type II secretion system protein [Thermoanaerobaculaceae bacterium]
MGTRSVLPALARTSPRPRPAGCEPRPAGRGRQRGFTLAGLIVVLAVMAIMLTVAIQSVTFQKRRENEEELIFRGGQFVEAIRLFRARNGRFPLSLDELYTAKPRVIRKKWIDPMTGKADWKPLFFGQDGQTIPLGPPAGRATPTPQPTPQPTPGAGAPGQPQGGPIVGVTSRSCEESIRVLDGRNRYCDWKFVFDPNKQTGPKPPVPSVVPTPKR